MRYSNGRVNLLGQEIFRVDDSPRYQFCVLEYRVQNRINFGTTILLVLEGDGGILRFFVQPKWRTFVQPEDLDYFESLLRDFPTRAAADPKALFKQLSSLSVGPLVTVEVGENISDRPNLVAMRSTFLGL